MSFFKIGKRIISESLDPLIIPEIGINHSGSLEKAIKIAKSAIDSGAEIIKHQTHIVNDEYSFHAKNIKPGNSDRSIYNIVKNNSLSEENEFKLMQYVKKRGAIFISTPFSKKAVDRLIKFKVPAIKIGSGECNNLLLVDYIARNKLPIILSTGMNNIYSVNRTLKIIEKYHSNVAILHCTNVYPAPENILRINNIKLLKKKFKKKIVGLSDHSKTIYPAIAAIALGAKIIEKHYVDSKKRIGPDISSSMDTSEFKELLKASKIVSNALDGEKKLIKEERVTARFAFASIVASKNINKGEKISINNITTKRPGTGNFLAFDYKKVIGKIAKKLIKKDHQIKFSDLINK